MRIPSGVTDQYIYFVAVDATDFTTRETALSSFTVYRSRNGAAAVAMTTPTINETSSSNMPGVYELLLDEDMTIGSGNDTEEMVFHITHAGMAPVTRSIELYRPKITVGNTFDVTSTGEGGVDFNNVNGSLTGGELGVGAFAANAITAAAIAAGAITDTEFTATGSGLSAVPWNAAWDAEVESEVNDALDTAISELSQAQPTATPTLRTGLMLLYMMARNQLVTQTSGTDAVEVYNDAGTLITKKTITDDGSDYTEAKMVSGP